MPVLTIGVRTDTADEHSAARHALALSVSEMLTAWVPARWCTVQKWRGRSMIARRRAKVDDRHRDLLPDSEDADPREVLDYLRKFSGSDIPAGS